MDARSIGERIHWLIKENKITAKELSKRTGIKESALTGYKKGEYAPSAEAIINISEYFGLTTDWLLTGKGEMHNRHANKSMTLEEFELLKNYNNLDESDRIRILERIRTINEMKAMLSKRLTEKPKQAKPTKPQQNPVAKLVKEVEAYKEKIGMRVEELSASAGLGNYLFEDGSYEILEFDADEVPDGADFGIRISGNSMEPIIHDKQIVWVKGQIQIENGQIGIFVYDDEAYCKKLHIDYEEREVWLVSLNEEYDPILINDELDFRTIGRVLL